MVDEHVPAAPVAHHLEVLGVLVDVEHDVQVLLVDDLLEVGDACARRPPAAGDSSSSASADPDARLRMSTGCRSESSASGLYHWRSWYRFTRPSAKYTPTRNRWGSSGGRSASFRQQLPLGAPRPHDVLGQLDGALRISPHSHRPRVATAVDGSVRRRGAARRASCATPCASASGAAPPDARASPLASRRTRRRSAAGLPRPAQHLDAPSTSRRRAARAPRAGCGARARPGCGRSAGSSTRAGSGSMTGCSASRSPAYQAHVPGVPDPPGQLDALVRVEERVGPAAGRVEHRARHEHGALPAREDVARVRGVALADARDPPPRRRDRRSGRRRGAG